MTIDLDPVMEVAHLGVRRATLFLGLGVNASESPSLVDYQLPHHTAIKILPGTVDPPKLAEFKEEFGLWIISCGLRELIESFAVFLDQVHDVCLRMAVEKQLKANGTWVTPTTAVFLKVINAQDDSFDRWARRKYAPYSLHGRWDQERKQFRSNVSTEDRKRYAKFELEIIGEMHRAGVRLLAGSDTGAFDTSPGFELHDELQMLVEAGLTPAEVLRCATSGAAEFLNLLDSRGTVEPGKAADLLLLDENPLVDSDNLQRINTVFLNGELYRRDDLDTMLATAERLAKQL